MLTASGKRFISESNIVTETLIYTIVYFIWFLEIRQVLYTILVQVLNYKRFNVLCVFNKLLFQLVKLPNLEIT